MEHCMSAGHPARPSGDVRVLSRLRLPVGPTGVGDSARTWVGVAVDVETTGLDMDRDRIIELALRRFRYDVDGVITEIGSPFSWLEDPGQPLPPEVVRLTGLTNEELSGHTLNDAGAAAIMHGADVVVAHNASFDRRHVEKRLPAVRGMAWACSCREIDWAARGFDGKGLGWLLSQAGQFHEGHRAGDDVDALIAMLRHRDQDGVTALAELIANAGTPGWIVRAVGAAFEVKDKLKARGYRWDPAGRVWMREVRDCDRMAEEFWLASHVYDPAARPRALGPSLEETDWYRRHGAV